MTRALVLSGGGSVGIAWQTGLAAGLAENDVALTDADFIVGTSAGSAVGALIARGGNYERRMEIYRDRARTGASPSSTSGTAARLTTEATAERMQKLTQLIGDALGGGASAEEARAAIGKFALEANTEPEEQFVAGFAYLDSTGASSRSSGAKGWPRGYACTAVDAESGEFVVWDGSVDVDLPRAVASSCAVPGMFPPITINGRRYVDGGMRSGTNADVASGHDRVLIVSLMAGNRLGGADNPWMDRYRRAMDSELGTLAEAGAGVETVLPDEEAAAALGANLMDGSRALEALETGIRQGKHEAERLRTFWSA